MRTIPGRTLGPAATNDKASTVRLLHFTLQKYLENVPPICSSIMAEIYPTYLNYQPGQELQPSPMKSQQHRRFLNTLHVSGEPTEPVRTELVIPLTLRLFYVYENRGLLAFQMAHAGIP